MLHPKTPAFVRAKHPNAPPAKAYALGRGPVTSECKENQLFKVNEVKVLRCFKTLRPRLNLFSAGIPDSFRNDVSPNMQRI